MDIKLIILISTLAILLYFRFAIKSDSGTSKGNSSGIVVVIILIFVNLNLSENNSTDQIVANEINNPPIQLKTGEVYRILKEADIMLNENFTIRNLMPGKIMLTPTDSNAYPFFILIDVYNRAERDPVIAQNEFINSMKFDSLISIKKIISNDSINVVKYNIVNGGKEYLGQSVLRFNPKTFVFGRSYNKVNGISEVSNKMVFEMMNDMRFLKN